MMITMSTLIGARSEKNLKASRVRTSLRVRDSPAISTFGFGTLPPSGVSSIPINFSIASVSTSKQALFVTKHCFKYASS